MWLIRFWAFMVVTLSVIFLLILGSMAFADTGLPAYLGWKNTDNTSQVQIEKGPTTTGPFDLLVQLTPGATSYVDTHNVPGDSACWRMRYFNGVAQGSPTTPKCKTFPLVPPTKPSTTTTQ